MQKLWRSLLGKKTINLLPLVLIMSDVDLAKQRERMPLSFCAYCTTVGRELGKRGSEEEGSLGGVCCNSALRNPISSRGLTLFLEVSRIPSDRFFFFKKLQGSVGVERTRIPGLHHHRGNLKASPPASECAIL